MEGTNTFRIIHKSSREEIIGTVLVEGCMMVLEEIFGRDLIKDFINQGGMDVLEFQLHMEDLKRTYGEFALPWKITIPYSLLDPYIYRTGKSLEDIVNKSKHCKNIRVVSHTELKFDKNLTEKWFEDAVSGVVGYVKECLKIKNLGEKISFICLVGGFARLKKLSNAVKDVFPNSLVVVPPDPNLAVVKGAVIYGFLKRIITSRTNKYTYGMGVLNDFIEGMHPEHKRINKNGEVLCKDVFDTIVESGEAIPVDYEIVRSYDITFPHKPLEIQIFLSVNKHPMLTTDEDCRLIGKISISVPKSGWKKGEIIRVRWFFGDTEIKVSAKDSQNIVRETKVEY